MKLVKDWRWLLRRAWSLRLIALAALLSALEVGLAVLTAYGVNPGMPVGVFAALSGVVTLAAAVARLVAQR